MIHCSWLMSALNTRASVGRATLMIVLSRLTVNRDTIRTLRIHQRRRRISGSVMAWRSSLVRRTTQWWYVVLVHRTCDVGHSTGTMHECQDRGFVEAAADDRRAKRPAVVVAG